MKYNILSSASGRGGWIDRYITKIQFNECGEISSSSSLDRYTIRKPFNLLMARRVILKNKLRTNGFYYRIISHEHKENEKN